MLADYGHGAVMAVPAHDQRDLDFARVFDLPVRVVVDTTAPITGAIPVIELDENGDPIDPFPDAESLDDLRYRGPDLIRLRAICEEVADFSLLEGVVPLPS